MYKELNQGFKDNYCKTCKNKNEFKNSYGIGIIW